MPLISNSFHYASICNKRASSLTPLSLAIIQNLPKILPCTWQTRLWVLTKPLLNQQIDGGKEAVNKVGNREDSESAMITLSNQPEQTWRVPFLFSHSGGIHSQWTHSIQDGRPLSQIIFHSWGPSEHTQSYPKTPSNTDLAANCWPLTPTWL